MSRSHTCHYAWAVFAVCCCLSGAVAGMVVNCRGVFYAAAAQELGVSPTTYATYQTCGGLVGVAVMPLVTRWFRTGPLRPVLTAYLAILCGSTIALGLAQTMFQCQVIGAVQGTVSTFLTLYPVPALIKNWFTEKRGLATGLAAVAGGLTASAMNLLIERMIRAWGWRAAYMAVGSGAFLLGAVPTLLWLVRTPAERGLQPYGGPARDPGAAHGGRVRFHRGLLPTFVPMAVLMATCFMATGYGQHLANYAQGLGFTAAMGAGLVACCMLGNVGGKLLGGALNDRLGVWGTSLLSLGSLVIAYAVLAAAPRQSTLLRIAAVLAGQTNAFLVVQVPLLLACLYTDSEEYDLCFSRLMMISSLTSAANNTVISLLYARSGSYAAGLALCGVLIAGDCALVLWLRRRSRQAAPGHTEKEFAHAAEKF